MFPKVCRVCGGSELLKSIDGKSELLELLHVCANITISSNDALPKYICQQCELGLQFSFRLRRQGEETEKRLRQELETQHDDTAAIMKFEAAPADITLASQVQRLSENCVVNKLEFNCMSENVDEQMQLQNVDLEVTEEMDEMEFQLEKSETALDAVPTTAADSEYQSEYDNFITKIKYQEESEQEANDLIEEIFDSDDEPLSVIKFETPPSFQHSPSANNTDNTYISVQHNAATKLDEPAVVYENDLCADDDQNSFDIDKCDAELSTDAKAENTNSVTNRESISVSSYTCDTCQMVLPNQGTYRRHIKTHGEDRFQCAQCNKWFPSRFRLQKHGLTHLDYAEQHKCSMCDRSYRLRSNLLRHIRTAHDKQRHMCFVCGEIFGRADVLKQHMVKHEDVYGFKCDECPERFKSQRYLDSHKHTHEAAKAKEGPSNKIYNCQYCGKESKHRYTHKNHLRIHTQERPHKCETCGKPFRTLASLIAHARIHVDARPYQCEHCLLSFRQRSHLKEHCMIHEGVTPHVCTICNLAFTKKSNMHVHMRIHSGEKPYKCINCGEQFAKQVTLRRHAIAVHGQVLEPGKDAVQQPVSLAAVTMLHDSDSNLEVNAAEKQNLNLVADDVIEINSPLNDVGEDMLCGSSLEPNFCNDYHSNFEDDAVVLVVDDDARFNSLYIMDD